VLPVLQRIVKSGTLHDEVEKHGPAEHTHHEKMIGTFVKKFTTNKLILWLAVLSFIMSVCIVVANFSFYSKIKEAYKGDIELAVFIGSFLAVIRICALLVKLLLTSRLIASLGVKRSLLFTPAIFATCIIMMILLRYVFQRDEAVLYMFGATCIVLDVLKTAVNSPVFLSIMQPLNVHDRLRSHNIVKGIMDPFAYLFSGIFLFELISIQHGINLTTLSYFLLLFAFCWIAGIFFVNREYYTTVLKAITSKFYNRADLVIDDTDTIAFIGKKLEEGTESEIIHILRLIRFQQTHIINEELAKKLLNHKADSVRDELLTLLLTGTMPVPVEPIKAVLADHTISLPLRQKAFTLLCNADADDQFIFSCTDDADPLIQSEALGKLLGNTSSAYYTNASIKINDLIVSGDSGNRMIAAMAIARSKNPGFKDHLVQLMNDNDNALSATPYNATGKWPH